MRIVFATDEHVDWISSRDHHLEKSLILPKIKVKEIYLLEDESEALIGWMRYGYFWDNTPFMNMLWIDEPFRNRGFGQQVVEFWENEMKRHGFKRVMTSTQADEGSQHFYRKLGYKDAGCLLLDAQPLEIISTKKLC
ncbi:GNAT family N-acetyltransferase [Paenibacillus sambharensis]|uniref:GNAT family N-acetyltransferase n=1 Tax=Paenibacillus sambharensis TaxID=1803190 RepID=A0A2W1LN62_9BACL|nr:GNAT family N-acetyltransferase [Paenibacillus sambharensis]PZD95894.1 GNAT family N-acetyltransferase [Paenibacillus sambharensis]